VTSMANAASATDRDDSTIDGLSGPGHPSDVITQIDTRSALSLRTAIEQMLASPAPIHATLRAAAKHLVTSPASTALALLADPWARASLFRRTPSTHNVDDPDFAPGTPEALRWLGGAWADGLVLPGETFVVLPGTDARTYVYLPMSGIVAHTGGPVGIYRDVGVIRLVLPARGTITLSGSTASLPAGLHASGHIEVLPRAYGRPVLNAVLTFDALSRVKQADRDETWRSVPVLEQGLDLLGSAWPGMRALVDRWVRGFITIAYDGCSRSHTSIYAPHVVMLSCESPLAVAEALCHETSHGRLFVFAAHNELLIDDYVARYSSPWRPDRRPMISFLNGVHAFVAVSDFYQRLAESDRSYQAIAERVIARQAPRVVKAWDFLESQATWTPTGQQVAATLAPIVNGLRS
jgi:HEXXH motif-containing protein